MAWASSVVASVGAEAAAWLGEGVVGEVEEAMALPLCHASQHAARQVAVAPAEAVVPAGAARVGAAAEGGGGAEGEHLLEGIDLLLVRPTLLAVAPLRRRLERGLEVRVSA